MRSVRLLVAGAYLTGFAGFVAGLVVEFVVSQPVGWTLLFFGALLMLGARLTARRLRLPAP